MSGELPRKFHERFAGLCELMDLYLITQAKRFRRISVPVRLKPICVFVCTPFNQIDEDHFDKVGCKWANKLGCGYAEAIFEYLMAVQRDDSLSEKLLAFLEDREMYARELESFTREQKWREQEWRKERNDWRDPLPPALTDADF